VKAAFSLIYQFGDHKQLRLTRGNAWYRLAAIIYGNPNIDLFRHMLEFDRRLVAYISAKSKSEI
jgi:hypothetical protein